MGLRHDGTRREQRPRHRARRAARDPRDRRARLRLARALRTQRPRAGRRLGRRRSSRASSRTPARGCSSATSTSRGPRRPAARRLPPERVLETEVDVYSPCAVGGTLNAESIPRLACRAVAGCANNQLAEPEDAERLRERGILYAPDYVVNAGGIIQLIGLEDEGWDEAAARRGGSPGSATRCETLFAEAEAEGITPRRGRRPARPSAAGRSRLGPRAPALAAVPQQPAHGEPEERKDEKCAETRTVPRKPGDEGHEHADAPEEPDDRGAHENGRIPPDRAGDRSACRTASGAAHRSTLGSSLKAERSCPAFRAWSTVSSRCARSSTDSRPSR